MHVAHIYSVSTGTRVRELYILGLGPIPNVRFYTDDTLTECTPTGNWPSSRLRLLFWREFPGYKYVLHQA